MQVPGKTRTLRLAAPAVVGLVFLAACDSSNSGVGKNATKPSSGESSRGALLIATRSKLCSTPTASAALRRHASGRSCRSRSSSASVTRTTG